MARDPIKVDQVQIEPGSSGTRLIRRAADGSLEFLDALVTGGITLLQLAGLKAVQNVLVVGKAGAGAGYTTIQSALDAIPASSSPTNPYFILIGPGVYQETINIVRDGVTLLGFGAILQSALEATPNVPGAYHTLVIQAALGTIPTQVTLENLTITNAHNNYACVRVVGGAGSTIGSNGIRINNCKMVANATGGNRTLWASASNSIRVQGGIMEDPQGLGLLLIQECADVVLSGVVRLPATSFRWDSAEAVPSLAHASYSLMGCSHLGYNSSLTPKVSFVSSVSPNTGYLLLSGLFGLTGVTVTTVNGVLRTLGCDLSTVATTGGYVYLRKTQHSTLAAAGGGKIYTETTVGTVSFVGEATKSVTFPARAVSTNYTVLLETTAASTNPGPWIANKSETGFDIHFGGVETLGVNWVTHHND